MINQTATFSALLLIFFCASFAQAAKARLDFDGDGKTDEAVYRCITATTLCYLLALKSSDNTLYAVQWGGLDPLLPFRTPLFMPQDYDGDGKADPAVVLNGRWYVLQSSNNQLLVGDAGITGEVQAVRGNYDGDGKADFAATRPETSFNRIYWYIRQSSDGATTRQQWGSPGRDIAIQGDYDGDGKTDLAVWAGGCEGRGGGYWYWLRSSDNQLSAVRWGYSDGCGGGGDFPVPDDYDGDGKIDVAVVRHLSSTDPPYYYILGSRDGFRAIQWGLNSDIIVRIP